MPLTSRYHLPNPSIPTPVAARPFSTLLTSFVAKVCLILSSIWRDSCRTRTVGKEPRQEKPHQNCGATAALFPSFLTVDGVILAALHRALAAAGDSTVDVLIGCRTATYIWRHLRLVYSRAESGSGRCFTFSLAAYVVGLCAVVG